MSGISRFSFIPPIPLLHLLICHLNLSYSSYYKLIKKRYCFDRLDMGTSYFLLGNKSDSPSVICQTTFYIQSPYNTQSIKLVDYIQAIIYKMESTLSSCGVLHQIPCTLRHIFLYVQYHLMILSCYSDNNSCPHLANICSTLHT